jgi:hypothetical protein
MVSYPQRSRKSLLRVRYVKYSTVSHRTQGGRTVPFQDDGHWLSGWDTYQPTKSLHCLASPAAS